MENILGATNYSKYEVVYHTADERLHMGGWGSYCNFFEIKDGDTALAQVNEEDGTCIFPLNEECGYFQRSYKNIVIPVTLLEIHNNYVLVKIHNKYDTIKRLYYRDKK